MTMTIIVGGLSLHHDHRHVQHDDPCDGDHGGGDNLGHWREEGCVI